MSYKESLCEGLFSSFGEVPAAGDGFDGQVWIDNSLKKIGLVRDNARANAPLPPISNYREVILPLVVSMLHRSQDMVRVLDYGGGVGLTYYQTVHALPSSQGLEYHIVEKETVCSAGREFFKGETPAPLFTTHIPKLQFDIIHFSSVLQYIEDWQSFLEHMCAINPKYLILVDVWAGNIPTFATSSIYYESRIPIWLLNIHELIDTLQEHGYSLTYKSTFQPCVLGKEQPLPMERIPQDHRINQTCNLIFASDNYKDIPGHEHA